MSPSDLVATTQRLFQREITHKVCPSCKDLDGSNWHWTPGGSLGTVQYSHHIEIKGLIKTSKSCSACRVILEGFSAKGQRLETRLSGRLELWGNVGGPLFVEGGDVHYLPHSAIEIYSPQGLPTPWTIVGNARTPPPSFRLEDTSLVLQWLQECVKEHPMCKSEKSNLPTRVLVVGSNHQEPYLWDEAGGNDGEYVALSHCWGDKEYPPLTTTKETLQARKREIRLSQLPQTFRDAVLLTRKLGHRYLWIDSLCIIQDDDRDWENESAHMSGVYQRAILTISADGAQNSHEGLFSPVNKESIAREVAPIALPGYAGASQLYVRKTGLNRYLPVHAITSSQDDPLRCRAWAFQEWLLSSRVVHFTKGELLWECRTHQRCECQTVHRLNAGRLDSKVGFFNNHIGEETQWQLFDWDKVVQEFSKRQLTYSRDTLPALSGLAETASIRKGGSYIGGLWKENLPEALLWYVGAHAPNTKRRDTYYSSSWSWASVIGNFTVSWELANAANPFGPLRSGFVIIKGLLATLPSPIMDCELRQRIYTDVYLNGVALKYSLILDVEEPALEITSMDRAIVVIIAIEPRTDGYRADLHALCLRRTQDECLQRVGILQLSCYDGGHREPAPDLVKWTSMLKLEEKVFTII